MASGRPRSRPPGPTAPGASLLAGQLPLVAEDSPALWPGPGTAGLARPAGSSRPPFSGAVPTLPALSPHVAPAINGGQRPPELYGHRLAGSLLPHAAPRAEDSGRGRSRLQSAGPLPGPPARRLGPHFLQWLPPQALCFWGFFRSPERGAPPPSFQGSWPHHGPAKSWSPPAGGPWSPTEGHVCRGAKVCVSHPPERGKAPASSPGPTERGAIASSDLSGSSLEARDVKNAPRGLDAHLLCWAAVGMFLSPRQAEAPPTNPSPETPPGQIWDSAWGCASTCHTSPPSLPYAAQKHVVATPLPKLSGPQFDQVACRCMNLYDSSYRQSQPYLHIWSSNSLY